MQQLNRLKTHLTPGLALLLLFGGACSDPARPGIAQFERISEDFNQLEMASDPAATELPASWALTIPDATMAHTEAARLQRLKLFAETDALATATLPAAQTARLIRIRQILTPAIKLDRFGVGFVTVSTAGPYLITDRRGGYVEFTSALARVPVASREDADMWISTLSSVADAIAAETERFTLDINDGISPPREVIIGARTELARWRKRPGTGNPLLVHFQLQIGRIPGLPGFESSRLLDEARTAFTNDLAPALAELDTALAAALEMASAEPGLWNTVGNENYYPALLEFHVREDVSPAQLSERAETAVEDAWAAADPILTALGLTEGSVVDRLALVPTSQSPPPAINENEAEPVASPVDVTTRAAQKIDWARNQLAQIITQGTIQPLRVRAVEAGEAIEPLPLEYRSASDRGWLVIDRNTALAWPEWMLPAMIYAETLPGRHLFASQSAALGPHASGLDGWSLYATDLASDLGGYDAQPAERLGYLRYLALQAGRAVADIGIHQERWTRAEAVDYFVTRIGLSSTLADLYVDEIIRDPAMSALAFAGREAIWAYRDRADRQLGADFNLRTFHDQILASGPRPLAVIEADIERWIEALRPQQRAE